MQLLHFVAIAALWPLVKKKTSYSTLAREIEQRFVITTCFWLALLLPPAKELFTGICTCQEKHTIKAAWWPCSVANGFCVLTSRIYQMLGLSPTRITSAWYRSDAHHGCLCSCDCSVML